jgi:outer membrane protein assembly factor BamE (lipoprotein component of BamABCDE complex)
MNKSKLAAVVIAGAVMMSFAGCASVGNESLRQESESSVQTKIVEGKTTREEVRAMFGSPAATSFTDGGLEIWNYELSKMKADAVNYIPLVGLFGSSASGTKKTLVVLFDENNVVKKYTMSESPVKVKTGVFNS